VSADRHVMGERDAEIVRLCDLGFLTLEEIGQRFGITRQRVYQIYQASGATKKRRRPKKLPRLQYCSLTNEWFLPSKQTSHRRENHPGFQCTDHDPEKMRAIIAAYQSGMTLRNMVKTFGYANVNTLSGILIHMRRKHGIPVRSQRYRLNLTPPPVTREIALR